MKQDLAVEPIKLLFAGDFCIRHSGVEHMTPEEIPALSLPVREMNSKYDVSVVNVETVFTDTPTPIKKSGPNIASPMAALDLLDAYKFTVGAFANNHVMDPNFAPNGGIAGSKLTMDVACRNIMIHTDCGITQAFKMASLNPAKMLGLDDEVGSVEVGKTADLVFVDNKFNVQKVLVNGEVQRL